MTNNSCTVCNLDKTNDWFWDAHQTMNDGKVWCVNGKKY